MAEEPETAAERKRASLPVWRKGSGTVLLSTRWRWSRQAQIGVASITFLLLTALLIWASFWLLPPKNACLVLIGAGYQNNLAIPHNVYGWNNLKGLAELSGDPNATFVWGSERVRLHQEPKELRSGDTWFNSLGKFPEKTVLIYLALHGGADHKGAYLLPDDAGASSNDRNRIYLSRILEVIAENVPREKNKLLVLDATQFTSHWQLGMLDNGFARALKDLENRIEAIPNLVVLCASDVNQRSWIIRQMQQTVFGYQMIEGLKGAAADRNNDGRINAWELFGYVEPSVRRWVWANRGETQVPILLPAGKTGKVAEQRARKMDLTVVRKHTPPEIPSGSEFELPAELTEAWKRHERLLSQVPSPADYSPQLWRRYQDYLIRYEQLLWAGDVEGAANLANKLLELEQDILREQRLELSALQNTLAMPSVAGLVVPGPDDRLAAFNDLWDAPPAEYGKRWANLVGGSGGADRITALLLRVQFYEFLLERAEKNPADNLERATRLLRVVDDSISPRPAEIQYLALLQRDRPRTPPPPPEYYALLQLALRVRVLAERTALASKPGVYAFSEAVYPWVQNQVEQADKDRRLGQDLLFASDSVNWKQGEEKLHAAERAYQQAQGDAEAIRNALALRNQVLAGLPYYSHWLAGMPLRGGTGATKKTIADDILQVENLWKHTHQLVELLENPQPQWIHNPPPPDPAHSRPHSIIDQTDLVRRGYEKLEGNFLQYCRDLANVDTPSVWRDAEDALLVPFRDYLLRQRLLTTMWRTSLRLLRESQGARDIPVADYAAQRSWCQESGKNQGLLALAVLGRHWFDRCRVVQPKPVEELPLESYLQVLRRLETFAVESNWWQSLDRAGEEIGYRWQKMSAEIDSLSAKSGNANLKQAGEDLRAADALARQIDGAGSLLLTHNPVEAYRRLEVESLLMWQARRTLDDHWFAEDPQAEPYYRVAGLLYLDDAIRLDARPEPRPQVLQLQKQLKQPGRLVFQGPGRRQLTSEQRFRLTYTLAPAEGAAVPEGFTVAWMEVGKGLQALAPDGTGRLVRRVGQKASDPLDCTLTSPVLNQVESQPPPAPRVEQTGLTMHGLYRGQHITLPTNIDLFPLANNIWGQQPLPTAGSLAVRGSAELQTRFGASNGAVAIVLDCSGSMGAPEGEKFGPSTKYAEATRALHQVLGKLPKGTTVSLWVFGQQLDSEEKNRVAENTVRRILDPVPWDPDQTAQLKSLMAKVAYPALKPWNESPIMHAILAAKNDLRGGTGFKTLLVITDGMDNRFDKDLKLNPQKQDIPTALRAAFNDSGIMVNVIGFKVEDDEEKKAREQFQVVQTLTIPGKFIPVNDAGELVSILDYALRQKLNYAIDSADNVNVARELNVSRLNENTQWYLPGLPPGGYKLRLFTDRRIEKDVQINAGDLLLIDLVSQGRGVALQRGLYARAEGMSKAWRVWEGWRCDVQQNQQLAGQALQMLVTMQKTVERPETVLEMLKPRAAWIEVEPISGMAPYCQRWGYRAGYPAPAWSFDVPLWPRQVTPSAAGGPPTLGGLARPRVRIWWNPDQETDFAARLDRGNHFQSLPELDQRQVQVDGDKIVVDSVQVEPHEVETSPGRREVMSCLVVRIHHAPGKPVWAQVGGVKPAGQEHRFYTQPNAYTGLFWPVTQADAAKALSNLSLISLTDFKNKAQARNFMIELTDLAAPDVDDNRPPSPFPFGK